MKLLEERIRKDGTVKAGNVLKVDSFLNHQMDIDLFNEMGKEWAHLFADRKIKNVYLLILLAFAITLSLSDIINELSPLMKVFIMDEKGKEKLDYYVNLSYDFSIMSTVLSIVKKSIWIGVLMIFDKKIENKPKS